MPCNCRRTLARAAAEKRHEPYCPRCGRPFSSENLKQKLEILLEGAAQELYDKVVALARQALHEDARLLAFCMAMGMIIFDVDCSWEEDGERVDDRQRRHPLDIEFDTPALCELKALNNLIRDLGVSGMPAKIDGKDAPLVKDW